jgi:hypothetical protein
MLAYRSALPIGFDIAPTVLSVVIAVSVSTAGWTLALRPGLAPAGAAIAGLAACAMHYLGVWAMEGPFHTSLDWAYVAASVILGVALAALAGYAATTIRNVRGRIFLEHYGCTTAETASGLGTLELLDAEPFDIILLDIQMPGMDGIEAFKRIRASGKSWAEVPVIGQRYYW